MKKNLFFILLLLFLTNIYSKMTDEERDYLLNKLTKKITIENIEDLKTFKEKSDSTKLKDGIPYNKTKIEEILNKYGFPQNYNFIETTSASVNIKDQGRCGCCWSHAATTALSYRYHKIGKNVDLSPQDALSCYLKDCDAGNYLIDTAMNLIKNGTVTEGCLPFSSGDGLIKDECPTTCKDGSTFKKYYAQNAYMTQDYYSKDTFYEIVALMMDQLINKGPLVTSIDVYYDFQILHYDPERCHNEVYTYDGISEYLGGHAVAVVGYGFMNSKFYWLLQNSWGESACDKGFVKVEFGQIGVEEVAFVEPYDGREWIIPIDVYLRMDSMDGECNIKISETGIFDIWKNTLDLGFINSETGNPFNFQCSRVSLLDGKKNVCYFEYYKFFTQKGLYKYSYHQTLGQDNYFYLDISSFSQFNFYGVDSFEAILSNFLFVSQEGSKIMLFYSSNGGDNRYFSPIYANENTTNALSDCKYFKFDIMEFVYCDIKQKEVDYFDDFSKLSYTPLVHNVLCGVKEESNVIVYKLDLTKYPVFKIKSLVLPKEKTINSKSVLTGIADIEGSLSGFNSVKNIFYGFIDIESQGINSTYMISCEINNPRTIANYLFNCYVDIYEGIEKSYDNIYLYPFNIPVQADYPYEIFIKEKIKAENYNPVLFVPKIQVYIESLCPDCINFITNSFKDFYEKVQKPNLADIEFIPFGNAKEVYNQTTKKYDFTCQHGDNECYGNLVETCSIQILGRIQSYSTILCIETNIAKYQKDFDKTLEFCLSNDQTSLQQVKDCIKSDLGNFYEHQMAQKTDEAHKWVPWVVVNGVHDENVENAIISSLIDFVCGDDKTKCYSN